MTLEEATKKYLGRRVKGVYNQNIVGKTGFVKRVKLSKITPYIGFDPTIILELETDALDKEWAVDYAELIEIVPLPLPG